ncbi:hypothetical protein CARUB_v10024611mg, partial [Capsella rubella]
NILEKSRETGLHTQDLEDSIAMVKSIKECGSPIAGDMIGYIKNSLSIIITTTTCGSDFSQDNSESNNLFTSVFKTAKEKACNMKWPQLNFKEQKDVESNELKDKEEEVSEKGEHIVETAKFEEFKAGKEASLKAWFRLGDMDGNVDVGGRVA